MTAANGIMRGRAWKFGDGVLNDSEVTTIETTREGIFDPAVLAGYCMAGIDPDFPKKAKPGDLIVAGNSFGKGQLHVQGPLGIKGLGLGLVCQSMTRSFFRLSVSAGIMMLPFVPDLSAHVEDGDSLEVDFRRGVVRNLTRDTELQAEPMPDFLWEFIEAGGERAWLASGRP